MSGIAGPLVFVDIETNGLSAVRGRVIEVAVIRVENNQVVRTLNTLIDPGTELPHFITDLTGITGTDLRSAPTFLQIADELHDILNGAVFVAHNVRFDYSFLKQEFKRVGKPFLPKQLCTVKLSRALFPQYRSHKLQSLIERHGFSVAARHRAYDDADVLWKFLQHVQQTFEPEVLQAAIAKQLRSPALPKGVDPELVANLPIGPGVYIFEDESGQPLYVGKSINIKQRVVSHFGRDHEETKEFNIAQTVRSITTHQTAGELEALLLESQLVKQLQPLYNRQLRRIDKLLLARQVIDEQGYARVTTEESSMIETGELGNVLAVYTRRSQMRDSLHMLQKTFDLCPKLLGLEKSKQACFMHQLRKCRGACVAEEPAEQYNRRLQIAFEHHRIKAWPFEGAVFVQEKASVPAPVSGIIVDQWCVLARVRQEEDCDPVIEHRPGVFDLDTYNILHSFFTSKIAKLKLQPLSPQQRMQFGL